MKTQDGLTSFLDGWTDIGKNIVYDVLGLSGNKVGHFIDALNLYQIQRTSKNLLSALNMNFKICDLRWDKIGTVVTDSPNVTVMFQV